MLFHPVNMLIIK